MRTTLLLTVLLAAPLPVTVAAPAHAHGDKKPASPSVTVVAEQTPWGIAGDSAKVNRTVTVDMSDALRFSPDSVAVEEGDTVRFAVRNAGRMLHEIVIGTPDELAKHAAMMARFPNMEHDEAYMAHVAAGKSGEIVWYFNRAGSFEFACLVAGHYEAGMRGTLTVTPRKGDAK